MQWKIKKLWPFTGKGSSSNTVNTNTQSEKDTPSPKWYHNISELPLHRFEDIVCDSNLYALVITGKPSDNDLLKAWADIQLEIADAANDQEYRLMSSMSRDVHKLSITIDQIHIALDQLKVRYVEKFAMLVNKWLVSSFKFDVRFPEDYDNDIARAKRRIKGLELDLSLKKAAYEGVKTKFASADGKFTRAYFQGMLITLSDHVKFEIKNTITVFEFYTRIRRLNDDIEKMKKQNNGRR